MAPSNGPTVTFGLVTWRHLLYVTFLYPAYKTNQSKVTFSLTQASPTIVVLSQLDGRYFLDITGRWYWNLEFVLFKKGEEDPIAESTYSSFFSRSVNVELDLEAGDYIVQVRLNKIVISQCFSTFCFLVFQVRLDRDRRRSSVSTHSFCVGGAL